MPDPPEVRKDVPSWPGQYSNADPHNLPPGAAQSQDNVEALVQGRLDVRRGMRPATFDSEIVDGRTFERPSLWLTSLDTSNIDPSTPPGDLVTWTPQITEIDWDVIGNNAPLHTTTGGKSVIQFDASNTEHIERVASFSRITSSSTPLTLFIVSSIASASSSARPWLGSNSSELITALTDSTTRVTDASGASVTFTNASARGTSLHCDLFQKTAAGVWRHWIDGIESAGTATAAGDMNFDDIGTSGVETSWFDGDMMLILAYEAVLSFPVINTIQTDYIDANFGTATSDLTYIPGDIIAQYTLHGPTGDLIVRELNDGDIRVSRNPA